MYRGETLAGLLPAVYRGPRGRYDHSIGPDHEVGIHPEDEHHVGA